MKYYITGDCHRHFRKVEFFCRHHGIPGEDVLIFYLEMSGLISFLDDSDKKLKRRTFEIADYIILCTWKS